MKNKTYVNKNFIEDKRNIIKDFIKLIYFIKVKIFANLYIVVFLFICNLLF